MKVTLVLGEYTRAVDGRLDVLGAGWVITGSPASFGIGVLFEAQPGEFGGKHTIVLELVDEDGRPVPAPDSDQPLVRVEGEFELIPPPGHKPTLPVVVPLAFNAANVPLPPGRRSEFRPGSTARLTRAGRSHSQRRPTSRRAALGSAGRRSR